MNATRLALLGILAAGMLAGGAALAAEGTVYKSPACGCCDKYVDYLRADGLDVEAVNVGNTDAVKDRLGVPERLRSCHTLVVDGYLVEGHVPIATIRRLLTERPPLAGIALPGMPFNSPGMGPPRPGTLQIHAIERSGEAGGVYAVE